MGVRQYAFVIFIFCIGSSPYAFGTKPITQAQPQGDSLRHHYVNGAPSMLIVHKPFGKMELTLYDLYGQVTFQMTVDSKLVSDSAYTFFPNGALRELILLGTPEDEYTEVLVQRMTFGSTNDPAWRVDSPLSKAGQRVHATNYYWHRHDKRWAKQEVITCQPHPATVRD